MDVLNFLFFIIVAALGGYLGYVLRLPMGVILGSMLAVGLSKYFGYLTFERNPWLSFANQVMLGIMLGVTFVNLDIQEIKKLRWGLFLILIGVLIMTFATGFVIQYISPLDGKTAIISAAPAAIAEMSILANALELNTPIIVILHLIRVVSVVFIFSLLLRYVHNKILTKKAAKEEEN